MKQNKTRLIIGLIVLNLLVLGAWFTSTLIEKNRKLSESMALAEKTGADFERIGIIPKADYIRLRRIDFDTRRSKVFSNEDFEFTCNTYRNLNGKLNSDQFKALVMVVCATFVATDKYTPEQRKQVLEIVTSMAKDSRADSAGVSKRFCVSVAKKIHTPDFRELLSWIVSNSDPRTQSLAQKELDSLKA